MAIKKYYVTVDDFGTTRWYKEAKCKVLHRENGPAIEYADGTKCWYQNGLLHRTDGPAIEYDDGDKFWYQNDKLHRTDGPAIVGSNGYMEWYINGAEMSEAEFNQRVKKCLNKMCLMR